MSEDEHLTDIVNETLELLNAYSTDSRLAGGAGPLASLLKQCEERVDAISNAQAAKVGALHHFACSGGTIISRAVAAQSNTILLSEVDPFSALGRSHAFAPTDVIGLMQSGARPMQDEIVEEAFLAVIAVIRRNSFLNGSKLVLRGHAHSQFCTQRSPASRLTLHQVLAKHFDVQSIVTVRHPLDSFLSLKLMEWVHFTPQTFEEYCRRYIQFIDAHEGINIFRYEDFTADASETVRTMSKALGLDYNPRWREMLPIISLTGDSGRSGDEIAPRPRRIISDEIKAEAEKSQAYAALCDRLGYNADVASGPVKASG